MKINLNALCTLQMPPPILQMVLFLLCTIYPGLQWSQSLPFYLIFYYGNCKLWWCDSYREKWGHSIILHHSPNCLGAVWQVEKSDFLCPPLRQLVWLHDLLVSDLDQVIELCHFNMCRSSILDSDLSLKLQTEKDIGHDLSSLPLAPGCVCYQGKMENLQGS